MKAVELIKILTRGDIDPISRGVCNLAGFDSQAEFAWEMFHGCIVMGIVKSDKDYFYLYVSGEERMDNPDVIVRLEDNEEVFLFELE